MPFLRLLLAALMTIGILSACTTAAKDNKVVIVTPPPPPREMVTVPSGYSGCFTQPAGWTNGIWYPEHRVCQYDPHRVQGAQGDAFVEAHWICTKYAPQSVNQGACINWNWKRGYWERGNEGNY